MDTRGVAERWPVLLGGAALTRAYVEDDLRAMFPGQVHYARDAFEGLSLMDRVMTAKRGGAPVIDPEREAALAARRARRERQRTVVTEALPEPATTPRSAPTSAADVAGARPRRSSAPGWSRASRWPTTRRCSTSGPPSSASGACAVPAAAQGPSYEELVETEGRPRLRYWLDRLVADQVLEAAVVYGYFPCYSEGNDLVVLDENGHSRAGPVLLPPPAPGAPAVPRRLLPARTGDRARRGRAATGHRRPADQRVHREAVRRATPTATTWRCTACPCS